MPAFSRSIRADDLDQQLAKNMRVYANAPVAAPVYGQGVTREPRAGQAEMVVYDSLGQPQVRQRVALGPLPEAKGQAEKPPDDFPRNKNQDKPKYEINYSLNGGFREDRLNWNIAAPISRPYSGRPNVLSELRWENVNVGQFNGKAEIISPSGWHFQGNVGYGIITAGAVQDSDYLGDYRTGEFSRSYSTANGGNMLDASLGMGYRFSQRDEDGLVRLSATPLVGYGYNEQNLLASNGYQAIPPSGPFLGLDSRYSAQWYGPWLGLKGTAQPWDWMELFGVFEYHWTDYYGRANWNLRTDFQHPISFRHNANGDGLMTGGGVRFKLDPHWAMEISGNYTSMTTNPGTDTTYFSDGYVGTTRLNRVQWYSWGANAGVRYRY